MKIAICIPTYNQADYLPLAIESALDQRDVETIVIVSDDASTDGTLRVVTRYASNPRVRYFRHPVNNGIAINAGWVMRQADTEFFVRLDSDDVLEPGYCAVLAETLCKYRSAGIAHSSVREIDQHGRLRRVRRLARMPGLQSPDEAVREGIRGYRVAANICMFRRSALPSEAVFRTGMNFCEDWDLFLRMADAGWGNIYIAEQLCRYRVWLDRNGVRVGRRKTEIEGIRRVFEETLIPAWQRRGWPLEPIRTARSRFAKIQARALAESRYTIEEKTAIIEELKRLSPGDSALTRRIWLANSSLAGPLRVFDRMLLSFKDVAKTCLSVVRRKASARDVPPV